MINIAEVLGNSCRNADFADGNTQGFHQLQGIVIGTIGGTKAGHGDTDDALAVETQLIERLYGYEQRQGRIQTTADTDNSLFTIDVVQTFYQAHHLDAENLLARLLHVLGLWNKGIRIDVAHQLELTLRCSLAGDFASVGITLRIDKSGIGAALNLQRLNINLAHLELWLQRESVTLFQQSSILINNCVAAINHILG